MESGGEGVEGVLYCLEGNHTLFILLGEVGVLHIHGQVVGGILEAECLVEVVVQLQQATCCLVDGHAIVGNANLLCEAV